MADNAATEYTNQHTPYRQLSKFMAICSKNVLEIGGNSECISALPFIEAGAASVTVSGLDHVQSETAGVLERISIVKADALKLRELFGDQMFDIVYGISILEHIPNPKLLFEQIFHVLRPGGMAYLQGSPLWTGAYGHHVWLCNWQDGTKYNYLFTPYPGLKSTNPIPDWGHLLYKPNDLAIKLKESGVYQGDIQIIIDSIFNGEMTNKESASSIMAAASNSPLLTLSADVSRHIMTDEMLLKLREKYPDKIEDWSISGIGLVLMRPKLEDVAQGSPYE